MANIRNKYIEGRFSPYFLFGESPDGERVNVCSTHNDNGALVTQEEADWLISDRNELLGVIKELCAALPEDVFDELWYGKLLKRKE